MGKAFLDFIRNNSNWNAAYSYLARAICLIAALIYGWNSGRDSFDSTHCAIMFVLAICSYYYLTLEARISELTRTNNR